MATLDLIKTFQFEAAHRTPFEEDASRLHGHSYRLDLVVEGELNNAYGWVMDYADITEAFESVYQKIDHRTLNDLEGLDSPTLPDLRKWILNEAQKHIPMLTDVHLRIEGYCTFATETICEDSDAHLPDRIGFGFEAAHALTSLPPEHKCHTMHGHSFRVEVAAESLEHLSGDLLDLYETLDHRCLNELEGLRNPTSENLSIWIWNMLAGRRDDLHAVLVAETCTARCIYYGR